jgi:probable F420-dependent oxidoreductase
VCVQFSVQLPTDRVDRPEEFLTADAVAEMARTAESAGFASGYVTDHPIPGDRWLATGGHHTLDPFVALSFAAAATRRLRLQTHVLVLPYRNAFLCAKSIASLDVLSGGRVIVGVAAGYLEAEFEALGVDFAERNELCDEAIGVMQRAWSESGIVVEGRHFRASGNSMLPPPHQRPYPPLWIGGNSRRAIRRAVELGDAWLPFPASGRLARHTHTASIEKLQDLEERIAYARNYARSVGREKPLDVCFVPFGLGMNALAGDLPPGRVVENARELEALGVSWLAVTISADTRSEWCERVARFGEQVIAALA